MYLKSTHSLLHFKLFISVKMLFIVTQFTGTYCNCLSGKGKKKKYALLKGSATQLVV